jgi:hypothetical protein
MPRSRERGRDRAIAAAHAKLDALPLTEQGLPMPYDDGKKLALAEWIEYRERGARHREARPAYDDGWRRPSPHTANAVWDQVLLPTLDRSAEDLVYLPSRLKWNELSADDQRALLVTTKQALVVVLDCFVIAGQQRRTVTFNRVFDALAERWSDWFRPAQETGPALRVRDMDPVSAYGSRRDLLLNGINLGTLYPLGQVKCHDLAVSVIGQPDRRKE